MIKQFTLSLFTLLLLSNHAFAQKILKVKGQKAIISLKNLKDVEEDEVLKVTSGGYEAGKIKITKIGRGKALAKVMEGMVSEGDSVEKIAENQAPVQSSKKRAFYVGFKKILLGEVSDGLPIGLKFTPDFMGLDLKYEMPFMKKISLEFQLIYAPGSTTVDANGLKETDFDASYLHLSANGKYFITDLFFAKAGAGVTKISTEGNFKLDSGQTDTLNSSLDMTALGFNLAAGIDYEIAHKYIIQAEAGYQINYNFSAEAAVSNGTDLVNFDLKGLIHSGFFVGASLGYKF